MRHLATVAMIVAALALPALGQRAVSHGGLSGHPVSGSHGFAGPHPVGGLTSRGPSGFGGVPVRHGPVAPVGPRGFVGNPGLHRFAPYAGTTRYNPGYRSPGGRVPYRGRGYGPDHSHHGHDGGDGHHHHRMIYWNGGVYAWPYPWGYTGPIFTGYVDPWLFEPDNYDYDNGGYYGYGAAAPYREYGMNPNAEPAYGAQDAAAPEQQPAPAESAQTTAPTRQSYSGAPLRQSTITLIFNDGRPPEQIRNFLLTSTTLTVLDQNYREIPLKDVNLAATEAANRAAGVEFRVPASH